MMDHGELEAPGVAVSLRESLKRPAQNGNRGDHAPLQCSRAMSVRHLYLKLDRRTSSPRGAYTAVYSEFVPAEKLLARKKRTSAGAFACLLPLVNAHWHLGMLPSLTGSTGAVRHQSDACLKTLSRHPMVLSR